MKAAREANVPVFFDLNYRSKLWSEADARDCFQEIIPYVDLLFASKGGLDTFYGIVHETSEGAMDLAIKELDLKAIALTGKKGKRSRELKLCSYAIGVDQPLVNGGWRLIEVVDRLGGGDAFAGGFITGYLEEPANLHWGVQLALPPAPSNTPCSAISSAPPATKSSPPFNAEEGGVFNANGF